MAAVAATGSVCIGATAAGGLGSSGGAWNGDVSLAATTRRVGSRPATRGVVRCGAEKAERRDEVAGMSRRLALAVLAGAAAVGNRVNPAEAAYGEAANIFASPKVQSGFVPFSGDGFQLKLPSKWNPSKEVEFPGQVLRYEDNFDATNNMSVSILKTEKSSITDYGSPEELLKFLSYLLGKQTYTGKTNSEGGFEGDKVATASILGTEVKEVNGKTYYNVNVLTRTADGDEGGKHQLIVATVDGGKLYILKVQAGDKRWFKGTKKLVEGTVDSFNVI